MKKGQRWPALVTAPNATMSYFLAFLAFFAFFAMLTSYSPTIGNSGICLEPITGTNSFLSELRAYSEIWLMIAPRLPRPDGYACGRAKYLGRLSSGDRTLLEG